MTRRAWLALLFQGTPATPDDPVCDPADRPGDLVILRWPNGVEWPISRQQYYDATGEWLGERRG